MPTDRVVEPHVCRRRALECTCRPDGLEPREDCDFHVGGEYPWRCCRCGRFVPRDTPREEERAKSS